MSYERTTSFSRALRPFTKVTICRRFQNSLAMRASERWWISPGRWERTAGTDRPQRCTPTSVSKCATPRRLTVGFCLSNSQICLSSKATTRLPGRAKAANFALT
jgi:hypothetical protein